MGESLAARSSTENQHNQAQVVPSVQALTDRIKDPAILRTQLMNVLLVGRDTTASLLSNLWFVLARLPEIWAKLKEEISQLNSEKPTYQKLNETKYLRHCINESLRLNPPVPVNQREAIRDTVLP